MTDRRVISRDDKARMIGGFGPEFATWADVSAQKCAERWQLEELRFVDSFSVCCVFFCRSAIYGDAVLKISRSASEIPHEYRALRDFEGHGVCRVFDYSERERALLEQRVMPGERLREAALNVRLDVFCDAYSGLHVRPGDASLYPTYIGWVRRITSYMEGKSGYDFFRGAMRRAEELCLALCEQYGRAMLLHGDLHHDNIISNGAGYTIIDPKGVVGDPVFDIARFVLNELDADRTHNENMTRVLHVIDVLGAKLHVPQSVLGQLFFIEAAMANCWSVESAEVPSSSDITLAGEVMLRLSQPEARI